MAIREPAEPNAQLLGLGSKLYPSNKQHMLCKDLTPFMQSLSWERQSRASEWKALIAGCFITFRSQGTNLLKHWLEHPYYNDDPYDGRWKCEMYSSDSSNTVLRSDASRKFFLAQPYTMQLKKPCIGAVRPWNTNKVNQCFTEVSLILGSMSQDATTSAGLQHTKNTST